MLESLPNRPLTDDEAERLKTQNPGIVPLSILKGGDDPYVIYTLAIYRRDAGTVHLLGYADGDGGWVVIEVFPEEEWSVSDQEDTIQDWMEKQYGDELEQTWLNEETRQLEVSF